MTGGSSGIGKCVAIEAAKVGADVTIIARDSEKLQAAVDEIRKHTINQDQRINYLSRQLRCYSRKEDSRPHCHLFPFCLL